MTQRNKKDKLGGIIFGAGLVVLALGALWKNETRYDYYRAASKTTEITAVDDATEQQLISYTGSVDKGLTLEGEYIESFTGYLTVKRLAEIYCWSKKTDDEGHTTWTQRWMTIIESNSRNQGVKQRLSSGRLYPPRYRINDFNVVSEKIEFVDAFDGIAPGGKKTALPVSQKLTREGDYLMLRKNRMHQLGDERISFSGLRVPDQVTWFGKYSAGEGVPHDENQRDGFINKIIQDSGVLHHLVVGDRSTALSTTRQYLSRMKWMVRGIGTSATVLGFQLIFSSFVSFFYGIPLIGWLAERGAFLLAVLLGLPLALITIVGGYLFGHPYLLVFLFATLVALGAYLISKRKQSKKVSQRLHKTLEEEHGRTLDFNDIKEMEFAELAHLVLGESEVNEQELDFLYGWGKQNGWKKDKVDELLQEVRRAGVVPVADHPSDWHLNQLIQLALADGYLSPHEVRTIRNVAEKAGFDRNTVDQLMAKVQQQSAV